MMDFDVQAGFLRVVYPLTSAISNIRYYGCDHPSIVNYTQTAWGELTVLLGNIKSITIFLVGDRLIVEDRPLAETGLFFDKFVTTLKENGIERLTFSAGVTKSELMSFISGLAARGGAPIRSSICIRLGKVELRRDEDTHLSGGGNVPVGKDQKTDRIIIGADGELDGIKEMYRMAEQRKRVDVRNAEEIVKRFIGVLVSEVDPIGLLASVKEAHEYTYTHAVNVGILTISLALRLGFPPPPSVRSGSQPCSMMWVRFSSRPRS